MGGPSQGLPARAGYRNFRYTARGNGEAQGGHTASQDLESFFVLFADQT